MSYDPETNLYTGYIYCIRNKINDKLYIGQTTRTVEKRWYDHVRHAANNSSKMVITKAIIKYGKDNFDVSTLYEISKDTKEELKKELDTLEIKLIKQFNSYANGGNGYNTEIGGSRGNISYEHVNVYDIEGNLLKRFNSFRDVSNYYGISDSIIYKICNGKQYNYKDKLVFRRNDEPFDKYTYINPERWYDVYQFDLDGNIIGKFHNTTHVYEITGINLRIGVIGKPHLLSGGYWWNFKPIFNYQGRSTNKPVDVYNKNTGEFIATFESFNQCSEELNINKDLIGPVCLGNKKTSGNYVFRYKGDPLDKYDYSTNRPGVKKKVNKYSLDDNYLCTYNSLKEASVDIGRNHGYISVCCKGDKKNAYGFKWYYAEDPNQPDKSKIIPRE